MLYPNSPVDRNSIFDTRDVLDRIAVIENDFDLDYEVYQGPSDFAAHIRSTDEDTADEYESTLALRDEMSIIFGDSVLLDGIPIIPDHQFEDYARELADELGLIPDENAWPANHIDWEAAATALQQDYTGFDFDGVTYWGRE